MLVAWLLVPGAAAAQSAETVYDRAADLLANGRDSEAAASFVESVALAPNASFAPDALFSAAKLYEERLAAPGEALDLYQRLVRDYPNSRVSLAASRRGAALAKHLGSPKDAEALARWKQILRDYPRARAQGSIAAARELLNSHPEWSGRFEVRLWLAAQLRQLGSLDHAARELEEARTIAKTDEDRFASTRRLASLETLRGNLDRAESLVRGLESGSRVRERVISDELAAISKKRLRRLLYSLCLIIIALSIAALALSLARATGWRHAPRAMLPPPAEVVFALPVLAVVQIMAFTTHQDVAPAVAIIASAGLALTWLSGAALRATPRSVGRLLFHLLWLVLGCGAAIFVAAHHGQLIDQILETVRFGPDV